MGYKETLVYGLRGKIIINYCGYLLIQTPGNFSFNGMGSEDTYSLILVHSYVLNESEVAYTLLPSIYRTVPKSR